MSNCPAADITNIVWLVSGIHAIAGDRTANNWRRYAHDARRGSVVRMNGEEWTPRSRQQTEIGDREARLSTLATAVGRLKELQPSLPEGSHLVMFMHGEFQTQDKKSYGILQSRGQPVANRELEGINQEKTVIKDRKGEQRDFDYLQRQQYVYCKAWLSEDGNRYNAEEIEHIGDGPRTPADLPKKKTGDTRHHIHGMIRSIDQRRNNILIQEGGQAPELVHAYETWNGRLLPLDWGEARLKNEHYMSFVQELKNWKAIRHVHLYGCSIGRWDTTLRTAPWGLLDLAKDIDKGVWAFTNITATEIWQETTPREQRDWKFRVRENRDDDTSATVIGACYRWGCSKKQGKRNTWPDRGYRKVFLCTSMGRMLGFSVRAIKAHQVKDGMLTGKRKWIVEIVRPNHVEQWNEKGYRYQRKDSDPPYTYMGYMYPYKYKEAEPLTAKTCIPNECPFKTHNRGVVCP